jgi:hypothetical protein
MSEPETEDLVSFAEAAEVFKRILWLNPADNQGIRGVVEDVRASEPWMDE